MSWSPTPTFPISGFEEVAREEGVNKARAVFRLFGRKLKAMGFEDVVPEEIVREGMKADEITKLIEADTDIGVLVLGASKDPSGPGPLVTTLVGGRLVGTFPVPITVVPGCLGLEEILGLGVSVAACKGGNGHRCPPNTGWWARFALPTLRVDPTEGLPHAYVRFPGRTFDPRVPDRRCLSGAGIDRRIVEAVPAPSAIAVRSTKCVAARASPRPPPRATPYRQSARPRMAATRRPPM